MPLVTRVVAFTTVLALTAAPVARASSTEEIARKLQALEEEVSALRRELERSRSTPAPAPEPGVSTPAPQAESLPAPPAPRAASWLSDFKIGGYGSTRFEMSDLRDAHSTFTFRRFVLTGDATIAERLRSVVEIEFERLNELEVERGQPVEGGRRGFSSAIEGSDGSAISLEQAWM